MQVVQTSHPLLTFIRFHLELGSYTIGLVELRLKSTLFICYMVLFLERRSIMLPREPIMLTLQYTTTR